VLCNWNGRQGDNLWPSQSKCCKFFAWCLVQRYRALGISLVLSSIRGFGRQLAFTSRYRVVPHEHEIMEVCRASRCTDSWKCLYLEAWLDYFCFWIELNLAFTSGWSRLCRISVSLGVGYLDVEGFASGKDIDHNWLFWGFSDWYIVRLWVTKDQRSGLEVSWQTY
jgi:hypothetical protein